MKAGTRQVSRDSSIRRDLTVFTFSDQTNLATKERRKDYGFDKPHRLTWLTEQVSSSQASWVVDKARTQDRGIRQLPERQLKKVTPMQGKNTAATTRSTVSVHSSLQFPAALFYWCGSVRLRVSG